jgi:hypothetical protein
MICEVVATLALFSIPYPSLMGGSTIIILFLDMLKFFKKCFFLNNFFFNFFLNENEASLGNFFLGISNLDK